MPVFRVNKVKDYAIIPIEYEMKRGSLTLIESHKRMLYIQFCR